MAVELPFQNIFLNINLETFCKVCHACLDELCGLRGPEFETFKDSSIECNSEEFSVATREIKSALSKLIRNNASKTELPDASWIDLDPGYAACLHECLEKRPKDVQAFRLNTMSRLSGATLTDFDWQIKWVLGSSSLSSLQQPLLNLDLTLSDTSQHSIELNCQELTRLISTLQQARDALTSSKPH